MPTRKYQRVAPDLARPGQNSIRSSPHGAGRFPARTTVAEQLPVGMFRANLGCATPFILAVIPFHQVSILFGDRTEPSQFASPRGPLQRTREHLFKSKPGQTFPPKCRAFRSPRPVSGTSVSPCAGRSGSRRFLRGARDKSLEIFRSCRFTRRKRSSPGPATAVLFPKKCERIPGLFFHSAVGKSAYHKVRSL